MRISSWSSDVCSSDLAEPLQEDVDLALDQRRERVAVAQRVIDGEAERLVVAARAEARDGVDDRDVIGVVALGVGREHAELGEPGRSEGRRVGEKWGSTCRTRGAPYHNKKKKRN